MDPQAIRYTVDTAGWRSIEQHIIDKANDHRNQLMHCKTWEEVLEHRAGAEALESVLIHIQQTIEKGDDEDSEV